MLTSLQALTRAVSQLSDPVFQGVVLRSLLLSLAVFLGLLTASVWGVRELVTGPGLVGPGWLGWLAGVLGGVGAAVLALWLFVPAAMLISTLYIERVALAVERHFYPALPLPQGASLSVQTWDGVVLGLQLVPLQVLTLVLTLLVPGVGLIIGLLITGWAIGRGFFVAVAMRRMSRVDALVLYRARRGAVLVPGVALAAVGLVPFANLLVPVLGTAAMVHVLQDRRTSGAGL